MPTFCFWLMYRQNQALLDLLEPEVLALGFELLGVELNQNGQNALLRVYIDRQDGISVDDCALVSHQLTGLLDVEDPIKGNYDLEVSSPGLDRPIFTIEQFGRYIDEVIKLHLYQKQDGRKRYTGLLVAVDDDKIVINCDDEDIEVPHSLIEKARLVPQF